MADLTCNVVGIGRSGGGDGRSSADAVPSTARRGIRRSDATGYEVKVYDPWPGEGVSWRTLSGWYTGFDPGTHAASSRDESGDVKAVFLHVP